MTVVIANEDITMFGLLDEDVILFKLTNSLLDSDFSSLCKFS